MKRKYLVLLLCAVLAVTCILAGCSKKSVKHFAGNYKSTFVDSQNVADSLNFELSIKSDNTFTLKRYAGIEEKFNYSGTWKSYTENNVARLLCLVEEGYKYSTSLPDIWNPYFELTILDDGSLVAAPGATSSKYSAVAAFGTGEDFFVSLVIFERV